MVSGSHLDSNHQDHTWILAIRITFQACYSTESAAVGFAAEDGAAAPQDPHCPATAECRQVVAVSSLMLFYTQSASMVVSGQMHVSTLGKRKNERHFSHHTKL